MDNNEAYGINKTISSKNQEYEKKTVVPFIRNLSINSCNKHLFSDISFPFNKRLSRKLKRDACKEFRSIIFNA